MRPNLGLVSLFLENQSKNVLQICKNNVRWCRKDSPSCGCDLFSYVWEIAVSVDFRTPLWEVATCTSTPLMHPKGDSSYCDYIAFGMKRTDAFLAERKNQCISGMKEPMHFWHRENWCISGWKENQCIFGHEERTNAFWGHEITYNVDFLILCWHARTRTQSAHTTQAQTTILVDLIFHTMTIYKWWSSTVNSGDDVTAVINGGVTSLAHTQQEVIN